MAVVICCALLVDSAGAATVAFDDAADAAYGGGWGSGNNGGAGFGAWTLRGSAALGGPNNGFFIGSSINNGSGASPGIDTSGESWGIYANSGALTAAYRSFSGGGLTVGQSFSINIDNGWIDTGNSVGFTIRNGNANSSHSDYNTGARFEFLYLGGDSVNSYKVVDAGGVRNIGVPFTDTGLRLRFTLTTADSYTLLVVDNASETTTVVTGILGGSGSSDSVALFNRNAGSGGSHDAFFNSLQVSDPEVLPSTINSPNAFAYAANAGWQDWRSGDGTRGVVVGEFVCSGYIFAGNFGWIHVGNGHPVNGLQYSNSSGSDYGVNHDGAGKLRGLAWGANIGWVRFEDTGNPRIDLTTGKMSGYAWGANVGWINLGDGSFYVQTNTIQPGGDTDGDGIADAYEFTHAGNLGAMNATTDSDGDGMSDQAEYQADTDPFDADDFLRILALSANADGSEAQLLWTSSPTRVYRIQKASALTPDSWADSGLGLISPDLGASTTRTVFDAPANQRFFRVRVMLPLLP